MKQIPEKNFDTITFTGSLRKNMCKFLGGSVERNNSESVPSKWEYHFGNKTIESDTDFITFKCPNLSTIFDNIVFNEFYTITLYH